MNLMILVMQNLNNYGVEDKRKKKRVVYSFREARLLVKLLRINPKNLLRHCDRDELKFHRIPPPDEC